jgi:hypothetical protein
MGSTTSTPSQPSLLDRKREIMTKFSSEPQVEASEFVTESQEGTPVDPEEEIQEVTLNDVENQIYKGIPEMFSVYPRDSLRSDRVYSGSEFTEEHGGKLLCVCFKSPLAAYPPGVVCSTTGDLKFFDLVYSPNIHVSKTMVLVSIPPEAEVNVINIGSYSSNILYVHEMFKKEDHPVWRYLSQDHAEELIRRDFQFANFFANMSPEADLLIVQLNPRAITYIIEQTEEMRCFAVSQDANLIEHIHDPSSRVLDSAINTDPLIIGKIDQTLELCVKAVLKNEDALSLVVPKYQDECRFFLRKVNEE